jgi:two-component system sensor histidine kinase VicK
MTAIKIRESGCGIPREDLGKVFEKFYQRNPAIPGTGLGLTICKEIVARYHGKISIFSEGLGKGTTVTVVLPRVANNRQ